MSPEKFIVAKSPYIGVDMGKIRGLIDHYQNRRFLVDKIQHMRTGCTPS
jgi:hypothetical protein